MQTFAPIQKQIEQYRLQRTVLIATLAADGIIATWNAVRYVVNAIVSAERAKNPDKVFTFEA